MPLIKNGEIVEDSWRRLDDEAELPGDGDVILSLDRLTADRDQIATRNGQTGVILPNSAEVEEIEALLPHLSLIALEFPAFTDGRAYSQAHQLRAKLGYTGELRAIGVVLADQAAFMRRVGIDAFETDGRQSLNTWKKALHSMTLAYQRGYSGETTTRHRAERSGRDKTQAEV